MDACGFQAGDLEGVVRHQADLFQPERLQNGAAQVIASGVGFETQAVVRFDGIVAGILELVGNWISNIPSSLRTARPM